MLPAGQVRIYLACGFTDMRNYAERLVMRSARPGASNAGVYPATPLRIITVALDAHRIVARASHPAERGELSPGGPDQKAAGARQHGGRPACDEESSRRPTRSSTYRRPSDEPKLCGVKWPDPLHNVRI